MVFVKGVKATFITKESDASGAYVRKEGLITRWSDIKWNGKLMVSFDGMWHKEVDVEDLVCPNCHGINGLTKTKINDIYEIYCNFCPSMGFQIIKLPIWNGNSWIYPSAKVAGREPCPDCKGSGKYVGAWVVETCRTCGGKS